MEAELSVFTTDCHKSLSPLSQRVGASSVLRVGGGELRRISGKLLNSYWEAEYICWSEV